MRRFRLYPLSWWWLVALASVLVGLLVVGVVSNLERAHEAERVRNETAHDAAAAVRQLNARISELTSTVLELDERSARERAELHAQNDAEVVRNAAERADLIRRIDALSQQVRELGGEPAAPPPAPTPSATTTTTTTTVRRPPPPPPASTTTTRPCVRAVIACIRLEARP